MDEIYEDLKETILRAQNLPLAPAPRLAAGA
jgi:hypothetical protein